MSGILSSTGILRAAGILSGVRQLRGDGMLTGDSPSLDLDWSSGALTAAAGGAAAVFSRASGATRTNAAGQLEPVAANAVAVDYVAALGGWAARFEEQKTNLIQRSEAFDTSPWTTTGAGVAADAGTPYPGFGGFFLAEDSASGNHNLASETIGHSGGTTYTLSVFARAGQRHLFLRSPNFINKGASFNLASGQVAASSADAAGIEPLAGGWLRCWISYAAVSGNGSVIIGLASTPVSVLTPYQGNGSSGIFVFGAQLEAGSRSSYIPTAGAQAVRQADSFSIATVPWWTAAAGTFALHCGAMNGSATTTARDLLQVGALNDRILLRAAGSAAQTNPSGFLGTGSGLVSYNAGAAGFASSERLALSYSGTLGRYARNGTVSADGGGFTPGAVSTTMTVGAGPGLNFLNGYIRGLRYWPVLKSAAELAGLTG